MYCIAVSECKAEILERRTFVRKFLQFSHLGITPVEFRWNGSEIQFVHVCHGGKCWIRTHFLSGLLQFYCQALDTKFFRLGLETSGCDISWTL